MVGWVGKGREENGMKIEGKGWDEMGRQRKGREGM